ncbi:MAG: glycosyltransferase family 4 protein [Verrucomicrobia bacterium]|nr:glycosyltransferase family 4 protein [Verrucomicrobiota bacterium]
MSAFTIWQLGMHFRPSGGGADRYFDSLLAGLEAIGRPFTAAAFDGATTGGGKFQRISLGASAAPIWKRRAAIRTWGAGVTAEPSPKILASHFALYSFFLPGDLNGARRVVHFHGPWAEEAAASGAGAAAVFCKRAIERRVYSRADHFITLSGAFRTLLVEKFGVAPERISVVPGAVDVEKFRPAENRNVIRQRLGWPLDRRAVFCVRRLVARMGIAELIEAFAGIAASHADTDLYIGGRGEMESGLRDQVRKLGLESRIFFCGFIPDDDLPGYYGASDFSIVPSQKLEGFGLVALEALACGVPVLVTPVGGLPEAVAELSGSLLLEGTSPSAIAGGLFRALGQPSSLPSSGECRAFAEKNYSLPAIARRVADVYARVASR